MYGRAFFHRVAAAALLGAHMSLDLAPVRRVVRPRPRVRRPQDWFGPDATALFVRRLRKRARRRLRGRARAARRLAVARNYLP